MVGISTIPGLWQLGFPTLSATSYCITRIYSHILKKKLIEVIEVHKPNYGSYRSSWTQHNPTEVIEFPLNFPWKWMPSEPQQPLLRIDAGRLGGRQPEAGGVEELRALDEAAVLGVGLPRRVRVRTVVPTYGDWEINCKVRCCVLLELWTIRNLQLLWAMKSKTGLYIELQVR